MQDQRKISGLKIKFIFLRFLQNKFFTFQKNKVHFSTIFQKNFFYLFFSLDITELYIFGCAASSIIVDGSVMLPRRVDVLMAEYIRDQIDIPRLAIEGGAVGTAQFVRCNML